MNTGLISVRYATALVDFAKQAGTLDDVYNEVKMLTLMFAKMSELRYVLENPVISASEKRQLIFNATGGNPTDTFRRFIDLLLYNKRETKVQDILLKFIALYRKEKNIHSGKLITAESVDEAIEKRLIQLISHRTGGGKVELQKVIMPEILGGFVLEVDDVRWDASLISQIKQIRNEYMERNQRMG